MEAETTDARSSPEAKGKRLKRVRNLANLSRDQLCEGGNINLHTLIGWENGRFGGLTRTGAERLISRLAQEGVQCTVEWLLHEIGPGPNIITDFATAKVDLHKKTPEKTSKSEEDKFIAEELILFRSQYSNATDFIVEDDGMLPLYNPGDYVAGKKRYPDKIMTVIGKDCIVQTEEGRIFLRNVRKGSLPNCYHLVCTNHHTQIEDSVLYNVKLISAAPIIWHRKKDTD